jgi:hypothetical protein
MSEKIIRAVLPVIPTILLITCVVAAFAVNDWNVQATLFPEDPHKTMERLLPFELGAETELLEDVDLKLSEDRSKLTFEAVLHSPLKVPITIKEMSAEVILDGNTVFISLPSEVEIPAQGSARLKLEGSLAEVEVSTQLPEEMPTPDIRNMRMKLDIRGIELEMGESGMGGVI